MRREIAEMAATRSRWLARRELLARTGVIKVHYFHFTTVTRSHTAGADREESALVVTGGRIARQD